jgi:transcription elongation factor GreB
VGDQNKIYFGAWVTLEKEDGSKVKYRIVGGDEIDTDSSKGYISVDSPMAKAILRKEAGDEVEITRGGVITRYHILDIEY